MEIGFVGLGKMGYHMVERLLSKGHKVVVSNRSQGKVIELAKKGAVASESYEDLISKLSVPRTIWMMIPHKNVDDVMVKLVPLLSRGDVLIDGGNSHYEKSVKRAEELKEKGIKFMDVGVSGGLAAAKSGYCMMVGGEEQGFNQVEPAIKDMCVQEGYGYFGNCGAGHYVKMVHNSIEYGMMQAMGEGYGLINQGPYPKTDLLKLSQVWNHGSIIRSFLMEMTVDGLKKHPNMADVEGIIPDSGEGKWAVQEAIDNRVPFTVNTHALMARYRSRTCNTFSDMLVSVLRDEFGGHGVIKK